MYPKPWLVMVTLVTCAGRDVGRTGSLASQEGRASQRPAGKTWRVEGDGGSRGITEAAAGDHYVGNHARASCGSGVAAEHRGCREDYVLAAAAAGGSRAIAKADVVRASAAGHIQASGRGTGGNAEGQLRRNGRIRTDIATDINNGVRVYRDSRSDVAFSRTEVAAQRQGIEQRRSRGGIRGGGIECRDEGVHATSEG